jgi:hypothetical protein
MANKSLGAAKQAKNDEFYTRYDDIERELTHYREQFRGKVVYCNCDDPAESAFADYFKLNFDFLGLKKLICTRYAKSTLFNASESFHFDKPRMRGAYVLEISQEDKEQPKVFGKTALSQEGDFRSDECVELLKEADIVCTNPPFSLFREYIAQLMKYEKKFLVIGSINVITYKEIFPLIKNNLLWGGYTNPKQFTSPSGEIEKLGNVQWWTNLDVSKRHEKLILIEKYSPEKYPHYDNYDAIEVSKTANIPVDFDGVMGVPISFLDKYNPEQFEIIGITKKVGFHLRTKIYEKQTQIDKNGKCSEVTKLNDGATIELATPPADKTYYVVQGKNYLQVYARILIKRKAKK